MEATEAMLVAGLKETEPLGELIDWREGFGRAEMAAAFKAMMAEAWQPIETAPKGVIGYAWMMLAWGGDDDPHTAEGMRCGDKFFAAGTFYCLGQEKKYELREVEVHPTHWAPMPPPPSNAGSNGPSVVAAKVRVD